MRCAELDRQALDELDEERRLHLAKVARVVCGDRRGLVRECDRHFDRVHEIMLAFTRRATAAGPAGGGTP
jgi:hypothetical protein